MQIFSAEPLHETIDSVLAVGKKASKQPTLNAFLSKPASKGKAGSSQPSGSKATSGENTHQIRTQHVEEQ